MDPSDSGYENNYKNSKCNKTNQFQTGLTTFTHQQNKVFSTHPHQTQSHLNNKNKNQTFLTFYFSKYLILLDVLRYPFESITITHFTYNAAHKHLQGTNA